MILILRNDTDQSNRNRYFCKKTAMRTFLFLLSGLIFSMGSFAQHTNIMISDDNGCNEPSIIMADEPTGNLDTKSGDEIMKILLKLNEEHGTTLIIVTHDPEIAVLTQRTVFIRDGVVAER